MNFLAKLGQILAKGLQVIGVVSGLLPAFGAKAQAAIQGPLQTAVNDLTAIGNVVVSVQTYLQAASGPDKLAAAGPAVINIIRTSEMVSGHEPANEPEFEAGCLDLTNAVVRIMKSLKSDNIKVVSGSHEIVANTALLATPTAVATSASAVAGQAPSVSTPPLPSVQQPNQ